MAYRNKTYVCFDGDTDIRYYLLMCAWRQHPDISFNFYNAHQLNSARDASQEQSIKRQLRIRLLNSKVFVVLIGERTRYLTKFVKWEMEQALALGLPIIAVNLNGSRACDATLCPPTIRDALAIHISFGTRIMQYALENWPGRDAMYRQQFRSGPYYYTPEVYASLGL
jgi:hypothetical protein